MIFFCFRVLKYWISFVQGTFFLRKASWQARSAKAKKVLMEIFQVLLEKKEKRISYIIGNNYQKLAYIIPTLSEERN